MYADYNRAPDSLCHSMPMMQKIIIFIIIVAAGTVTGKFFGRIAGERQVAEMQQRHQAR